ncbi:hypothetical protein CEXT_767441 [Caerostris extrusa]|uniref:Uncharacterized protein n=1 Tax=Caerostris extrusa TaxID=172846 RepID=A0AAV4RLI4_CAEEX|nr:hypothetical protein CEXT_767441 [Caerostris extrusa]
MTRELPQTTHSGGIFRLRRIRTRLFLSTATHSVRTASSHLHLYSNMFSLMYEAFQRAASLWNPQTQKGRLVGIVIPRETNGT